MLTRRWCTVQMQWHPGPGRMVRLELPSVRFNLIKKKSYERGMPGTQYTFYRYALIWRRSRYQISIRDSHRLEAKAGAGKLDAQSQPGSFIE